MLPSVPSSGQGRENDERVANKIQSIAKSLWDRVCTLWKELAETPYPSERPQAAATVAAHVIGRSIPEVTEIGPLCETAHGVLLRGYGLYYCILASLVASALAAENALGLPLQPPPNTE